MASHSPETLLSNCILLVILAIFGFNKDICLITVVLFSIVGVTFLIFLHWEAMLISFLAKRNIVLPFTDVQSLLEESDTQIAVSIHIILERFSLIKYNLL